MARVALKVVERVPFYTEEIELWSEDIPKDGHSLHYSISYPESFRPEIPSYFIRRYSQRGDVVLDPFCGIGTTALEANLLGRAAYASDINPLSMRIAAAKLNPADITQATLQLQMINLNRPVSSQIYNEYFAPFFDINTFREIYNLRHELHNKKDPVSSFIEYIALSLLHGHSAGYFSVYTFPQISLSPARQEELNIKRGQSPDYRAVVPRILRKTAAAMRDGIPSVLIQMERNNKLAQRDARDLSYIPNSSVDLVVTAPPLPSSSDICSKTWLKLWFAGLSSGNFENRLFQSKSLSTWLEFMNEVLFELARVVRPGGRAVLDLREVKLNRKQLLLDEELMLLVEEQLSRYWDAELTLINKAKMRKIKNCLKERDRSKLKNQNRLFVLRRR